MHPEAKVSLASVWVLAGCSDRSFFWGRLFSLVHTWSQPDKCKLNNHKHGEQLSLEKVLHYSEWKILKLLFICTIYTVLTLYSTLVICIIACLKIAQWALQIELPYCLTAYRKKYFIYMIKLSHTELCFAQWSGFIIRPWPYLRPLQRPFRAPNECSRWFGSPRRVFETSC